jgi:hypothetical protein
MVAKKEEAKDETFPEGFEKYDTTIDDYPDHNWDTHTVLTGEVIKTKMATLERNDKEVEVQIVAVNNGNEVVALWETFSLKEFMGTLKKGDKVWIKCEGKKPMKGGKTLRIFDARVQRG